MPVYFKTQHTSKNQILEQICSLLGGRAAEQLTQDDVCTGASNDIQRATELARKMVTRFGMSDKLGLGGYGDDNNEVFLGRDFSSTPNYSEKIAAEIDAEINSIIANTDATLVNAGVIAPDEVRTKLINDENSGYDGLDEELEEEPLDFEDEEQEGNGSITSIDDVDDITDKMSPAYNK